MDHKSRTEWETQQSRLPGEETFNFRIRLRKEWEAIQAGQQTELNDHWKQFIPDIDPNEATQNISPEQKVLDDFIELISITDAYNQWVGKGHVDARGRKDSIKVRCPNPAHPDNHPSAWLNTEKNVYHCGACSMGGDIWDLAAWRFGYPVPGYKNDPASFRSLREQIGQYFGLYIEKGIAGDLHVVQSVPESNTGEPEQNQQHTENIAYTPQGSEYAEQHLETVRLHPSIDWRTIVPENTFLRAYLEATTVDDSPEEFHFFNGLLGLGAAFGGLRTLEDSPQVSGNLFVCLVGGTGTGKSKSKRHLVHLLHQALPYKPDDQPPFGTQYLNGIQSGEVLIKQFQHAIVDPVTNKVIGYWPGVKAVLDFEELAELVSKNSRMGSTLKNVLMNMYDSPVWLSSTSMAHGNIVAEKPFGSAITTTQYDSIRSLISKGDDVSGFANRWTFVTGPAKKQFSVNRAQVDTSRASGLLAGINMRTRAHELITWADTGEKAWDTFFHSTLHAARAQTDMTIIQRIDLMLKKLFLLFAVNENSSQVTESIVTRVLSLFPYLIETYGVVEQKISATVEGDDTDRIMRHIHRLTTNSRGPTATELYRMMKNKNNSPTKVRKILENLVVLGMVTELKVPPGPKGGRPTSCYVLAPGVRMEAIQ